MRPLSLDICQLMRYAYLQHRLVFLEDFDKVVKSLGEKGVVFEHYDNLEGVTREGDVHLMGPLKAVWFKDPSGNILNAMSGIS